LEAAPRSLGVCSEKSWGLLGEVFNGLFGLIRKKHPKIWWYGINVVTLQADSENIKQHFYY
jgi:hypothetical protein